MKNAMKQALGAVALSAIALSMIGTNGVVAREKAGVVKPPPPPSADIEQGQMLDKGPRPPIKAMGAAENDLCGLPYTPKCITDAPAVDIETGQMLDKGPRWPHNQKIEAAEDDPCKRPGTQCDPRDGGASAARNKSDITNPNPPSTAKPKGKGPKGDGSHGYETPLR